MGERDTVKIYGNTNLPAGTPERPLVTFALFAYNQEKYIREAVEGAFSQTYSPLEIILSDDCSSDRTFDIIEDLSRRYSGLHRIIARKNATNLGLSGHINAVSSTTTGTIVILAAGDDISCPQRSKALVDLYSSDARIFSIFSDYYTIPDAPTPTRYSISKSQIGLIELLYNGGGVQIGATYSYRRDCFTWPSALPNWLTSEDRLLPFRAAVLGRLAYSPLRLIKYRKHETNNIGPPKTARVLGFNDERHFPQLIHELRTAINERRIPLSAGLFFIAYAKLRSYQIRLLRNKDIAEPVVNAIFFPLRIIRRLATIRQKVSSGMLK